MRYIGGGHKRMYRIIDFRRDKDNCPATVRTIEYDPNRSARIALVVYADGEKRYIIAPAGIRVGQTIMSGPGVAPELGNRDSSGNCHPQHRASSRSGCRYGPQRRNIRSAHRT